MYKIFIDNFVVIFTGGHIPIRIEEESCGSELGFGRRLRNLQRRQSKGDKPSRRTHQFLQINISNIPAIKSDSEFLDRRCSSLSFDILVIPADPPWPTRQEYLTCRQSRQTLGRHVKSYEIRRMDMTYAKSENYQRIRMKNPAQRMTPYTPRMSVRTTHAL